jgi:hypothetical protein
MYRRRSCRRWFLWQRMAHPDLDRLFDYLVTFAQQMLGKQGEFYPFGAALATDGDLLTFGATDASDHPKSEVLIDTLVQDFRARAANGTIRACGICFDVLVSLPGDVKKTDAIQCRLEHANGEAVNVFTPWSRRLFGSIRYGEVFATKREKDIFVQASN